MKLLKEMGRRKESERREGRQVAGRERKEDGREGGDWKEEQKGMGGSRRA